MKRAGPYPFVRKLSWLHLGLTAFALCSATWVQSAERRFEHSALAVGEIGSAGRSPVHTDAIEAELIAGTWRVPRAGDQVHLPDGNSREWRPIQADTNNWFENDSLKGGYCFVPLVVESNCVMLLEACGHDLVYVNGEPRAGDPYAYGYVHLPVTFHAGTNDLLFRCSRGRLQVGLATLSDPVSLNLADPTFPDLIVGEQADTWGAVVAINATPETQQDLVLHAGLPNQESTITRLPTLPPMTCRKIKFPIRGKLPAQEGKVDLELSLSGGKDNVQCRGAAELRVRRADQTQKRTFVSDMDGSVQYWALNPAQPLPGKTSPPALFLSVHGASVEAMGQADAYSPKTWGHIAAPTNRRPYGFDWESWGRLDALEVLTLAKAALQPDPHRIYLTGHSMGGHGTWQLGAWFPDHFAAIGPSAGWISFASYANGIRFTNPTPVEAMLQRASAVCDTLDLETNYLQEGIYIIHGADDDNVPASESKKMVEQLGRFHHDFQYHQQPGAGHWWDVSDEPGADCVDWAPMFDFFAHHAMPDNQSVRHINFTTVNPGVSARCHWLEIEQQIHSLRKSIVDVRWDPGKRRFVGTTENVMRLALSINHIKPGEALKLELDGQRLDSIPWPTGSKLFLQNDNGQWRTVSSLSLALKGPHRSGPFKDAFRHHMVFVYGTAGTPAENAWAYHKARFDAESFWYRGNGSVELIPDTGFDPRAEPDRGVILYGNADSNQAWRTLLADSPVQVRRNEIKIGSRVVSGDDLACLFLRPRNDSTVACVAAVSGTGLPGLRLTERLPYFLSGVEYPDVTVLGSEMLKENSKGVRAAGFFGNDWSLENGEFAWRD